MAKCGFIRDGYTRPGFIEETEFHPALKFMYRPILGPDREGILRRVAESHATKSPDGKTEKGAVEGERIICRETIARIASWDLVDDQGTQVELTAVNSYGVETTLMAKLWAIVSGTSVSDPETKEADDAKN